jgi:hypothetical protein
VPGTRTRSGSRHTWGNVLQLEQADRELLARLARRAPLLPGADVLVFIDIDSTPLLLVFCCLPLQRAADAAVSSPPVTPDRSGVPDSGAIVISNS